MFALRQTRLNVTLNVTLGWRLRKRVVEGDGGEVPEILGKQERRLWRRRTAEEGMADIRSACPANLSLTEREFFHFLRIVP